MPSPVRTPTHPMRGLSPRRPSSLHKLSSHPIAALAFLTPNSPSRPCSTAADDPIATSTTRLDPTQIDVRPPPPLRDSFAYSSSASLDQPRRSCVSKAPSMATQQPRYGGPPPDLGRGHPGLGSPSGPELGDAAFQPINGNSPSERSHNGSSAYKRASRKGAPKKFTCPHTGCGKVYSRQEHLQRHQLNREGSPCPAPMVLTLLNHLCLPRQPQGDLSMRRPRMRSEVRPRGPAHET